MGPHRHHKVITERWEISCDRTRPCTSAIGRHSKKLGGEKMYVLTDTLLHLVGGGHGSSTNSGSSTATTQSCTTLPNGGTQCTSGNGRSMVIQTYDRNGNLINSMQCTENRSVSVDLGNKAISGGIKGGGGTSCSSSRISAPASSPASGNHKLVIQMPYQGSL